MRGVCPFCNSPVRLDQIFTEKWARQALAMMAGLPDETPGYIAQFRPLSGQVLQWRKAHRLIKELRQLILNSKYVQIERLPARPVTFQMWADGMGRMIEVPPGNLPLPNHNYLKKIVYQLADDADRAKEMARRKERFHTNPVRPENDNDLIPLNEVVKRYGPFKKPSKREDDG